MARLHVANTQRYRFVGDVTTVWLCPGNQFAGSTEAPRVALEPYVSLCWLIWHLLGTNAALLPKTDC